MYKIMLADDEGIVIDALTFIIEKNFSGLCTIEHAKTGRAVIELAERFSPEIVFMDIQMPGINGIEAMKEIRKTNKNIIFIVVSAYDKFDYASEAINLGVWTYINKPIEQSLIVRTLREVMDKVDENRKKRSNDLMIREKLNTVVPIIESGFVYSVLFQEGDAAETENFKNILAIEPDQGYVLVVKCGDHREQGQLTNAVGATVKAQSFYSELRDIVKTFFDGIVGAMMSNMVVVYIPYQSDGQRDEYQERIRIIENAREMERKLRKRIDARFRIGIGQVKEIYEASDSYKEAMDALKYSTGIVAHFKDLPLGCGYEKDYPVETEKALFEAVKRGDLQEAAAEAGRFFDWMRQTHGDRIMDIKLKVLEFVLFIEKISYESGGMVYQFGARSDYLQTIMSLDTYEEIGDWFIDKIREACRNIQTKKAESSVSLVAKAIDYIHASYNRDISLDDVSREVNVSPYYFSRLFKEESGKNFIEYVTDIRIQKAKELLTGSDKSMKEICSEIGYSDPNYFSRIFKKNQGLTPTEYKEGK